MRLKYFSAVCFFMCSFAILVFNAKKLIYLSTKFSTKADSFLNFISAFFIEKQHDFCLFMFHVKQFVYKIVHKI